MTGSNELSNDTNYRSNRWSGLSILRFSTLATDNFKNNKMIVNIRINKGINDTHLIS